MGDNEEPAATGETQPNEKADRAGRGDTDLADLGAPTGSADQLEGAGRAADADDDEGDAASPAVVGTSDAEIATALAGGAVVAVPGVGGYCLAVRIGTPGAEARLASLAADPDGPHYAVGHVKDVKCTHLGVERRARAPARTVLAGSGRRVPAACGSGRGCGRRRSCGGRRRRRCGGGHRFERRRRRRRRRRYRRWRQGRGRGRGRGEQRDTHRGGWAVTVGMPDGRALRRLCKEHGPWRTIPLTFNEATEVAQCVRRDRRRARRRRGPSRRRAADAGRRHGLPGADPARGRAASPLHRRHHGHGGAEALVRSVAVEVELTEPGRSMVFGDRSDLRDGSPAAASMRGDRARACRKDDLGSNQRRIDAGQKGVTALTQVGQCSRPSHEAPRAVTFQSGHRLPASASPKTPSEQSSRAPRAAGARCARCSPERLVEGSTPSMAERHQHGEEPRRPSSPELSAACHVEQYRA